MRKKIGLIAMGQKENRPLWQDLIDRLEPDVEVDFRGVLDGFTRPEIGERFAFEDGENYIVTEMPDRSSVHISEAGAREQVRRIAAEFFDGGAAAVLVLCTGDFDRTGEEKGLFVLPEDVIFGLLSGLRQERIGFLVPEEGQIRESEEHYAAFHPIVRAASPYGPEEKRRAAAASFKSDPVNVIVTDCMGFTAEMGRVIAKESGREVIVPRVVIPEILRSILTQR